MESWEIVLVALLTALVSGLLGALITAARIGGKVDRLAQTVESLLKAIEETDTELSGFAPIGGRVESLYQKIGQIEAAWEEHRKAEGHTPSLIRLARIEDKLDRLQEDTQRLWDKVRDRRTDR